MKAVNLDASEGGWISYVVASSADIALGGSGSGHFGHAGRPGKRGGSAPKGAGVLGAIGRCSGRDTEYLVVLDGSGTIIEEHDGDAESVGDRLPDAAKVTVHNHPEPVTFSPSDLEVFISHGLTDQYVVDSNNTVYHLSKTEDTPTARELFPDKMDPGAYARDLVRSAHSDIYQKYLTGWIKDPENVVISDQVIREETIQSIVDQFKLVYQTQSNLSETTKLGGPGSGHFGHAGRPGKRGGSAPKGGGGAAQGPAWEYGVSGELKGDFAVSEGDPELASIRDRFIEIEKEKTKAKTLLSIAEEDIGMGLDYLDDAKMFRRDSASAYFGKIEGDPDELTARAINAERWADDYITRGEKAQIEAKAVYEGIVAEQNALTVTDTPMTVIPKIAPQAGLSQSAIVSINAGTGQFNSMVDDREVQWGVTKQVTFTKTTGGDRANYDGVVHVSSWDGSKTVVHELGHWLEDADFQAAAAARGFLNLRTGDARPRSLATIIPGSGYRGGERAKSDRFLHPYIGKIYDSGMTEVLSMGLERMFTNPSMFAKRDPEHFDLIWRVMRNDYSSDTMGRYTEASGMI